jgi:hypothetical protein
MDTLKRQFSDALKREGKSITTYYNRDTVPCIFRINEDGNRETDRIRIFYDISAPIKQGQLIEYRNRIYLVLNQETAENDIYYKSSIVQTNAELKWTKDNVIYKMPCYAGDLISPMPTDGSVISVIDGNIEIITEDTDRSRLLTLNTTVETLGGVYEVVNYVYKTGFAYKYIKRTVGTVTPPVYVINIVGETSYDIVSTQTATLTVETTIDGEPEANPTVTWTSSNENVATVSDGVITLLAVGTVTITATWTEGNVSDTLDITVSDSTPVANYTIQVTHTGNPTLYVGGSNKTIYLYPYKDGVQTNEIPVAYEIIGKEAGMFATETYDPVLYKLILKAAMVTANIGKTFTVRGYNTEHGIEGTKVFEIIDY